MLVGPTIRRRRLGAYLRTLREARGLKIEEVASRLELAPSTLSRIETGKAPTRTTYLRLLLDIYGVDDIADRQALTELAREGQRRGWWTEWGELLPPGYDDYLGLEAEAAQVRMFSSRFVPALLQTAEYARALIETRRPDLTAAQVQSLVTVALRRHDILTEPDSDPGSGDGGTASDAQLAVVLDESVLLRSVGDAHVRRGQLDRLVTAAAHPFVTLQVLRFSASAAYPVPVAAFTVLSFATEVDPDVLCTEGPRGQVIVEDRPADVRALATAFADLTYAALSPAQSVDLIRELAGSADASAG